MPDRLTRFLLAISMAIAYPAFAVSPAQAQETMTVSSTYQSRADELLEILKGSEKEQQFFAKSFLDAVPVPQFRALLVQLKAQYGEPQAIENIVPASDQDGTIEIGFAKAIVSMRMVLDRDAPYPVIGLLVTGASMRGDNIAKISDEIAALNGMAGFEIAEITSAGPRKINNLNSDHHFAIGSTFKLYVLAELARSIKVGARKWDDVVPLTQKSLPSGMLQNWPDNTPLTLQTLATLMISVSDNTATDILMAELGRDKLARLVRQTGHASPETALPMLTTLEAFALKMPINDDLRKRYVAASENGQIKILQDERQRLGRDSISITNLATTPRHIDTIEWFASPSYISKLLAYIDQQDDPVVRAILSINSIIPPADAKRWTYFGGKGGSESGVVSFAFLATAKSGKSYVISGSWNDDKAPVNNAKFLTIMNRLLNIVAEQ